MSVCGEGGKVKAGYDCEVLPVVSGGGGSFATGLFTVKCDFVDHVSDLQSAAFWSRFPSISPPTPKLPLGIDVSPAASNLAISSRSESFESLFTLLSEFVAISERSGEDEVGLRLRGRWKADYSAGRVAEERRYGPPGFCELAVSAPSCPSTCTYKQRRSRIGIA